LTKLYYYRDGLIKKLGKKSQVKKTHQKYLIKIVGSKIISPKWHFGQIGHGGKKTIWGVFFTEIPSEKG
jgi:hypothetical protein